MLNKVQNNIDYKIIENFFNIWVLKELIYDDRFEKYYNTFIDDKWIISNKKVQGKLKEIYDFIGQYDVTSDWPNKIHLLKKEKIQYILEKTWVEYEYGWSFSDDINTQIMWWDISMVLEKHTENYYNRDEQIVKVKDGLKVYLDSLYNNWIYNIWTTETIDDIVKKIVKIINKK